MARGDPDCCSWCGYGSFQLCPRHIREKVNGKWKVVEERWICPECRMIEHPTTYYEESEAQRRYPDPTDAIAGWLPDWRKIINGPLRFE